MLRILNIGLALLWLGLFGLGMWLLSTPRPALSGLGLALAASPPLLFLLAQRRIHGNSRDHPILVSVLSGLGCVMTMVGSQRFGEQHQWIVALALLSLVTWVAYQRWILRASRPDR